RAQRPVRGSRRGDGGVRLRDGVRIARQRHGLRFVRELTGIAADAAQCERAAAAGARLAERTGLYRAWRRNTLLRLTVLGRRIPPTLVTYGLKKRITPPRRWINRVGGQQR